MCSTSVSAADIPLRPNSVNSLVIDSLIPDRSSVSYHLHHHQHHHHLGGPSFAISPPCRAGSAHEILSEMAVETMMSPNSHLFQHNNAAVAAAAANANEYEYGPGFVDKLKSKFLSISKQCDHHHLQTENHRLTKSIHSGKTANCLIHRMNGRNNMKRFASAENLMHDKASSLHSCSDESSEQNSSYDDQLEGHHPRDHDHDHDHHRDEPELFSKKSRPSSRINNSNSNDGGLAPIPVPRLKRQTPLLNGRPAPSSDKLFPLQRSRNLSENIINGDIGGGGGGGGDRLFHGDKNPPVTKSPSKISDPQSSSPLILSVKSDDDDLPIKGNRLVSGDRKTVSSSEIPPLPPNGKRRLYTPNTQNAANSRNRLNSSSYRSISQPQIQIPINHPPPPNNNINGSPLTPVLHIDDDDDDDDKLSTMMMMMISSKPTVVNGLSIMKLSNNKYDRSDSDTNTTTTTTIAPQPQRPQSQLNQRGLSDNLPSRRGQESRPHEIKTISPSSKTPSNVANGHLVVKPKELSPRIISTVASLFERKPPSPSSVKPLPPPKPPLPAKSLLRSGGIIIESKSPFNSSALKPADIPSSRRKIDVLASSSPSSPNVTSTTTSPLTPPHSPISGGGGGGGGDSKGQTPPVAILISPSPANRQVGNHNHNLSAPIISPPPPPQSLLSSSSKISGDKQQSSKSKLSSSDKIGGTPPPAKDVVVVMKLEELPKSDIVKTVKKLFEHNAAHPPPIPSSSSPAISIVAPSSQPSGSPPRPTISPKSSLLSRRTICTKTAQSDNGVPLVMSDKRPANNGLALASRPDDDFVPKESPIFVSPPPPATESSRTPPPPPPPHSERSQKDASGSLLMKNESQDDLDDAGLGGTSADSHSSAKEKPEAKVFENGVTLRRVEPKVTQKENSPQKTKDPDEKRVVSSLASLSASLSANANSVVFDFRDRPDVKPMIAQQPVGFGGFVTPSFENDDDGDGDTTKDADALDAPIDLPVPLAVHFIGSHVVIDGGMLLKRRKKNLKISFDDESTSTYEYPSEVSLLNDGMEERNPDHLIEPPDQAGGTAPVSSGLNIRNLTLSSSIPSSDSLANYKPVVLGNCSKFELGLSRNQPSAATSSANHQAMSANNKNEMMSEMMMRTNSNGHQHRKIGEQEDGGKGGRGGVVVDMVKPAEANESTSWSTSSERASDLLF